MNSYMIDIDLPDVMDQEFMRLIPYQRTTISRMMKQGIISNYSLSFDRKKLWIIMNAETLKDINLKLATFPIYGYIHFTIYSLLMHESNTLATPQLWLN
jgi:hypothetical protein